MALILIAIPLWAGPAQNKTEVIADDATKTVRIVVDGKDIAVFDRAGMHVDGDADFTGGVRPGIYSGPGATIAPDATPAPRAP